MLKKSILPIVLVLFLTFFTASVFANPKCKDPSSLCVGLVTDVGVIDDKSFNQSAWDGLQKAALKLDVRIKYIETRDANDYLSNIELFTDNGYDIVVTVGFGLSEATVQAAKKHPKVKFIGVDQLQAEPVSNIAGLIFNEKNAGFEAGALAAMLSRSNVIAAVLATDMVPPIVSFKKGYESGAKYIKPKIKIISTFHPGGFDVAFTDPEWGASTAKQAIAQGADVIFSLGGLTGNGGLIETATHKDKYCIGVDKDQWLTLPAAQPCLVSCAMKKITPAVFELISMAKKNKFPSGNYFGNIGLAPFHDFDDKIPQSVKNRLVEIAKGLEKGTIKP